MDDVPGLYYSAIRNARLHLPKAIPQGGGALSGDRRTRFLDWSNKVDILTLNKGATNFASDEDIVRSFGDYREAVGKMLFERVHFNGVALGGQLKDIGSCWDGSKVGRVNEMDSLYVIQVNNAVVDPTETLGLYRIFLGSSLGRFEVKALEIREELANEYERVIEELPVPSNLMHAGYACPAYSGLRYNGPAATSQFLTNEQSLLSWDVTPAFVFPKSNQLNDAVRQILQPLIRQNPDKLFPQGELHLVPDIVENLWRLTTAHMEADVLRVLSSVAPAKKSLSMCKVLSSWMKAWDESEPGGYLPTYPFDIVKSLEEYRALEALEERETARCRLNQVMRFAHIWIRPEKLKEFNESGKSNVSVNTAAMKHIILKEGLAGKGQFFAPEKNDDLTMTLVPAVFQTLADKSRHSSDHALLPCLKIGHFSVLASLASSTLELLEDIQDQCRILHEEAMTEVNENQGI